MWACSTRAIRLPVHRLSLSPFLTSFSSLRNSAVGKGRVSDNKFEASPMNVWACVRLTGWLNGGATDPEGGA